MSAEMNFPHAQEMAPPDVPRRIVSRVSTGDKVFRSVVRGAGLAVFVITGMILTFLLTRAWSSFRTVGFSFFTTKLFNVNVNNFGIGALLPDGVIIAAIALIIAVPVAVATALYISEYAPSWLRRPLVAVIDLMAAIPSIIFALWGFAFLMGRMTGVDSWLARHLS